MLQSNVLFRGKSVVLAFGEDCGAYPTDELYDNMKMKFLTVGPMGHAYAALMLHSTIMHDTLLFTNALVLYVSVCSQPGATQ